MAEIDIQRAKDIASDATRTAKKGAKQALELAEATRQSKAVNFLLPSDHKKSRRGEMEKWFKHLLRLRKHYKDKDFCK